MTESEFRDWVRHAQGRLEERLLILEGRFALMAAGAATGGTDEGSRAREVSEVAASTSSAPAEGIVA